MNRKHSDKTEQLTGGYRHKRTGPGVSRGNLRPRRSFGTSVDAETYSEFVRLCSDHNLRLSEILEQLVDDGSFRAAAEQLSNISTIIEKCQLPDDCFKN